MNGYQARIYDAWDQTPAEWRDPARAPTPFQTHSFLSAWYETLGAVPGVTPVIVEIRDAQGRAAALWPLALSVCGGLREIGFADGELTDNCMPLTGSAFPADQAGFDALWRTTLQALPPADVLRVQKMPPHAMGRSNPMLALPSVGPGPLSRHVIDMAETFDEYSASRATKFSKEQRRVWRVFMRHEGAAFEVVGDPGRAAMLFAQFETHQEARMREIGVDYKLGAPEYRDFSRRLVERGVADGSVVFGALTAGDELAGGLIGLTNGRDVSFVRICFAPGKWTVCSPGRLVLEKTLEWLHARGHRAVDLSIGEFPYKLDFGVRLEPLHAMVAPLSLRGRPVWAMSEIRRHLKKSAWVRAMRDKWTSRGKAPAAQGQG